MLSHHGRLFDRDRLRSSARRDSDLVTLIGRSLIDMYWSNFRRPLRSYRRLDQTEFAIDGDFDPEDLFTPSEDGFRQHVTSFTRHNPYNAIIHTAASQLASLVKDVETRALLQRVAHHLPRQRPPVRIRNHRLPSRSRSWQPAYDLSRDILRGFGGSYDPKDIVAPGFIMQTWQAWEHLVSLSLRIAFGVRNVSLQPHFSIGTRRHGSVATTLGVRPDALVRISSDVGVRRILVDAKYRGHVERSSFTVSNADIYEALAFSRATSIEEVVLAYPRRAEREPTPAVEVGSVREFCRIQVDDVLIRACELGVCGISRRGGFIKFVRALSDFVSKTTAP